MSRSMPDLNELTATVARMHTQLSAHADAGVRALLTHYAAAEQRFAADLADPRDYALACASALMLVQAVAQSARDAGR